MAGVITTGAHPKALWPGIHAWWGRQYGEHPLESEDLFEWTTSDKSYEEDVQVKGFGLAPVKPEGSSIAYDSEIQGFVTRYVNVAYALGYIVTHEEIRDDLYEIVGKRRAGANAFSQRQTKENVCAQVYNRAFDTSFPGGDGKPLLATDHPSDAGAWSNTLAVPADLSEGSLEDLMIQVMGATNDKGLNISLVPETIHIPRQLIYETTRILKSVLQNFSANNAVNALRETGALPGGIRMNHYFSDEDAWFLRTNAPQGMTGFQREELTFDRENDFDTKNAKAASYQRFVVGWSDPRGLYGSAGS